MEQSVSFIVRREARVVRGKMHSATHVFLPLFAWLKSDAVRRISHLGDVVKFLHLFFLP